MILEIVFLYKRIIKSYLVKRYLAFYCFLQCSFFFPGSRPESPLGFYEKPRDLVEETIRQRVKAADDRKKRLLAAYDHAAKSQPAGQARIVEFDNFKRADGKYCVMFCKVFAIKHRVYFCNKA